MSDSRFFFLRRSGTPIVLSKHQDHPKDGQFHRTMLPGNCYFAMLTTPVTIFWFRRDLRLTDNRGLFHALQSGRPVLPVFIFDKQILESLDDKSDRRVTFIHSALTQMHQQLGSLGSTIDIRYGNPEEMFQELAQDYTVEAVYTNHDYEPYAQRRDKGVAAMLQSLGIEFRTFKDQVIFEQSEIVKDDGKPYTVFTPYSRKWKAACRADAFLGFDCEKLSHHYYKQAVKEIPELAAMGFLAKEIAFPSVDINEELISKYATQRDFPGLSGTSRLGVHLRFGTISIRRLARHASALSESFLNELIWREFYQMILWNFPQVREGKAFKPAYDMIPWRNNEQEFLAWCEGNTGYPIVDAGMRELNQTGFMHNRVRMIVASFLSKHLLIDWRWGEAYFASKLMDFDLASNNGGWQWAAGSGCDAAPYFRVFNPRLQMEKFDPQKLYIRKWVPEFEQLTYPMPIVAHEYARNRCLETYGSVLRR